MVVFPFSVEGWNTLYLLHFCIGEEHVFWQSEHLAQVNYQPCGSLVIRRSSEIAYLVCTLQQHSCLQSRWCSCVSVFLISSLSQKKWTKSVKSWWYKDVFIRKIKGEFKSPQLLCWPLLLLYMYFCKVSTAQFSGWRMCQFHEFLKFSFFFFFGLIQ